MDFDTLGQQMRGELSLDCYLHRVHLQRLLNMLNNND